MAERAVHLAGRINPYRTVCGRSIWEVVFLVGAIDRVTCARCRRWIERQAERERGTEDGSVKLIGVSGAP